MSCFCPPGFSATPSNDQCISISSITATFSGSPLPVINSPFDDPIYAGWGTIFYDDISNLPKPLKTTGVTDNLLTINGNYYNTQFVVDGVGNVVKSLKGGPGVSIYNDTISHGPAMFQSNLWGSYTLGNVGRINTAGVWSNPTVDNQWIGFSFCVSASSASTYCIGIGGDDYVRLKLNGQQIFQSTTGGTGFPSCCVAAGNAYRTSSSPLGTNAYSMTLAHFLVFQITLNSGTNIFELEGLSTGAGAILAAEVYSASVQTLTAMTTPAQLSGVTIFSTLDKVGSTFDLGQTSGYSCPSGFVFNNCSSPVCSLIVYTGCTGTTTTIPPTTTSTTRSYINSGYIPVNDCNVLTQLPLNVQCSVTNVSGLPSNANGSISLNITGGVPPYTIRWTYPNGVDRIGGSTIGGLSAGQYTATITDYFGDYTFTTTCFVGKVSPTTTTTTTTPPIPSYSEYVFCMTINLKNKRGISQVKNLTFQLYNNIGGYPSWISDTNDEIVYFDNTLGTSGAWSLSAATNSDLNTQNYFGATWPSWQVFNSSQPAPVPSLSPSYVGWQMVSTLSSQSTTTTLGACEDFLLLTLNYYWALNNSDIPTTFTFSGSPCNGSNSTPWFKWYLLGGLTTSDILDYEMYCEDLDNPGYVHWDVSGILNTQSQVGGIYNWNGSPTITPTSGGAPDYNSLGWEGPCPPSGQTHRYQVTLTANLLAGGTLTSSLIFTSSTP